MRYKDNRWKKKRENILRRDKYYCRNCKRLGIEKEADTVHHVKPVDHYPELYLDSKNLISLCGTCHNKMHNRNDGSLTALGWSWVRLIYPND